MNRWIFCLLLATCPLVVSHAQPAQSELPPHCLQSFSIKDKSLVIGAATMSCRTAELRREDLFRTISKLKATGEIDGAVLAKDLASIEAKLKAEQGSKNWLGLTGAVTGNFLATLGLTACLETGGAGCALAAVGKILSLVGVIDSATSEADKASNAAALRNAIADIRKRNENKKSEAKAMRDRQVAEFTRMCTEVQKQCL